jgi:hypothetical protein
MRALRVGVVTATAIGLALLPTVATAGAQDRVTGSGSVSIPVGARVAAHSGPLGEGPAGTMTLDEPSGRFQVKVSCVVVSGHTAVVGGLDQSGVSHFFAVQDNGRTGDLANVSNGPPGVAPDQQVCAAVLSTSDFLFPVTGDFTVLDS